MLSRQIMEGILYLIYYFAIHLWYIFLILGGVFLLLARRWSFATTSLSGKIGSRTFLFTAVLLLVLGLYGAYVHLDNQVFYKWRTELKDRKLERTQNTVLDTDLVFPGLSLPKGTRVRWSNRFDVKKKEQATIEDIWWISLPESTELFGFIFDKDWSVYLMEETIKGHLLGTQYIEELPVCGEIILSKKGKPIQAHIAQDTELNGQTIAKNSIIYFVVEDEFQKEYLRIEHPENKTSTFKIELKTDKDD